MIKWISIAVAAGLMALELWWLYGSAPNQQAKMTDHITAVTMFVLPILLISLVLVISRHPQLSYFVALGVIGALVLVLLLCLSADEEFTIGAICFWISVVAWVGLVPILVSLIKDHRRKV